MLHDAVTPPELQDNAALFHSPARDTVQSSHILDCNAIQLYRIVITPGLARDNKAAFKPNAEQMEERQMT
ncbi:MAG: hypothetical protein ABJH20_02975, partial [Rhizobiaceae bacterium]